MSVSRGVPQGCGANCRYAVSRRNTSSARAVARDGDEVALAGVGRSREDVLVKRRSLILGIMLLAASVVLVIVSLRHNDAPPRYRPVRPTRPGDSRSAQTSGGRSPFTAVAPAATKTAGALLFNDLEDVAKCFEQAFGPSSDGLAYRGFEVCEPSARMIIPSGSRLEILEKYQPEYAAKVKVLDGPAKGEVGFVHEAWIAPSPWSRDRS